MSHSKASHVGTTLQIAVDWILKNMYPFPLATCNNMGHCIIAARRVHLNEGEEAMVQTLDIIFFKLNY